MNRLRSLAGPALAAAAAVAPFPALAGADWLILENFTLIDGTGAAPRAIETLIARDGVIQHVGAARAPETAAGDTIRKTDLDGAFVIPGLIDTHVHVARFPDTRNRAEQILTRGLRGGVTSIRDVGGDARALHDLQRATLLDEALLPTIVYSGVYGGPTLFRDPRIVRTSRGYPPGGAPWARAVDEQTDIALAIAQTLGAGAAGVKIYGNLDAGLVRAVASEAQRQGLAIWAHGTVFPAGPDDLVESGADVLSHAPYLIWAALPDIPDDYDARTKAPWRDTPHDDPEIVALLESMAANDVYLDSTLFVFNMMHTFSPEVQADWAGEAFEWGAQITGLAHRLGVRVTTGTDWFEPANHYAPPHTHLEMQLLIEHAGFTPMDAIVAATRNGAGALGILDERGTVEAGKAADLLVLDEDPLEDIRRTAGALRMVVKDGQIVQPRR